MSNFFSSVPAIKPILSTIAPGIATSSLISALSSISPTVANVSLTSNSFIDDIFLSAKNENNLIKLENSYKDPQAIIDEINNLKDKISIKSQNLHDNIEQINNLKIYQSEDEKQNEEKLPSLVSEMKIIELPTSFMPMIFSYSMNIEDDQNDIWSLDKGRLADIENQSKSLAKFNQSFEKSKNEIGLMMEKLRNTYSFGSTEGFARLFPPKVFENELVLGLFFSLISNSGSRINNIITSIKDKKNVYPEDYQKFLSTTTQQLLADLIPFTKFPTSESVANHTGMLINTINDCIDLAALDEPQIQPFVLDAKIMSFVNVNEISRGLGKSLDYIHGDEQTSVQVDVDDDQIDDEMGGQVDDEQTQTQHTADEVGGQAEIDQTHTQQIDDEVGRQVDVEQTHTQQIDDEQGGRIETDFTGPLSIVKTIFDTPEQVEFFSKPINEKVLNRVLALKPISEIVQFGNQISSITSFSDLENFKTKDTSISDSKVKTSQNRYGSFLNAFSVDLEPNPQNFKRISNFFEPFISNLNSSTINFSNSNSLLSTNTASLSLSLDDVSEKLTTKNLINWEKLSALLLNSSLDFQSLNPFLLNYLPILANSFWLVFNTIEKTEIQHPESISKFRHVLYPLQITFREAAAVNHEKFSEIPAISIMNKESFSPAHVSIVMYILAFYTNLKTDSMSLQINDMLSHLKSPTINTVNKIIVAKIFDFSYSLLTCSRDEVPTCTQTVRGDAAFVQFFSMAQNCASLVQERFTEMLLNRQNMNTYRDLFAVNNSLISWLSNLPSSTTSAAGVPNLISSIVSKSLDYMIFSYSPKAQSKEFVEFGKGGDKTRVGGAANLADFLLNEFKIALGNSPINLYKTTTDTELGPGLSNLSIFLAKPAVDFSIQEGFFKSSTGKRLLGEHYIFTTEKLDLQQLSRLPEISTILGTNLWISTPNKNLGGHKYSQGGNNLYLTSQKHDISIIHNAIKFFDLIFDKKWQVEEIDDLQIPKNLKQIKIPKIDQIEGYAGSTEIAKSKSFFIKFGETKERDVQLKSVALFNAESSFFIEEGVTIPKYQTLKNTSPLPQIDQRVVFKKNLLLLNEELKYNKLDTITNPLPTTTPTPTFSTNEVENSMKSLSGLLNELQTAAENINKFNTIVGYSIPLTLTNLKISLLNDTVIQHFLKYKLLYFNQSFLKVNEEANAHCKQLYENCATIKLEAIAPVLDFLTDLSDFEAYYVAIYKMLIEIALKNGKRFGCILDIQTLNKKPFYFHLIILYLIHRQMIKIDPARYNNIII